MCRCKGIIHISGLTSRYSWLAVHKADLIARFLRVDCRELPLTAVIFCQLIPCPPWPLWHQPVDHNHAVLTAPLERSTCPNQQRLEWSKSLTLEWPHPLAPYCRSDWSWPCRCAAGSSWPMAKFYWHGVWCSVHMSTGLVKEVEGYENC